METVAVPPAQKAPVRYRESFIPAARPTCEHRADGVLLLRSLTPRLVIRETCFGDFARRWAIERGDVPAIQERDGENRWRGLTWSQFWQQLQSVAAGLLSLGLGSKRPLMILSENSVEQAVLAAAAEYAGIPTAAASPAYSLQSTGFERLKGLYALLEPAAVFVQDAARYRDALTALGVAPHEVISTRCDGIGCVSWQTLAHRTHMPEHARRLAEARDAIRPEHVARIFFTSGSTGEPKGVPLSYGNLNAFLSQVIYQAGNGPPPVLLDWLPWNHAYGGLGTMSRIMANGGSLYIDDGRPTPQLFSRTLRNLHDISTSLFATVPAVWMMLLTELERNAELARKFFRNMQYMSFGSASLPQPLWARIQKLAEQTTGERIVFVAGYGSTETGALGSNNAQSGDDSTNIGVPQPGVELKLVPLEGGDGRYEVRMRGPTLFAGYHKRSDLTQAAFDAEGFYRLGDAVRLVDPADPTRGMRYAGRTVEDFKLVNGTWVRTGAVRMGLVGLCAPLLQDAVICGHDRHYVAALAWPNVTACHALAPEFAGLETAELARHPLLLQMLRKKLASADSQTANSARVHRVMLMAEPATIDSGEIADKGYINQAAVRSRRAHLVEELYDEVPGEHIVLGK